MRGLNGSHEDLAARAPARYGPATVPAAGATTRRFHDPPPSRIRQLGEAKHPEDAQKAEKPGLGAGPGHPEPRRERRDNSRPFKDDHAA